MNTNNCDAGHRSKLTDSAVPPTMASRPVYRSLHPDTTASQHLLVVEAAALEEGMAANLALRFEPVASRLQVVVCGDNATMKDALRCSTVEETLSAISRFLQHATMGQRVYAIGTEPFLWSVHGAALRHGLDDRQVLLCHSGSLKRRVWCTHCHGMTEDVTTNIVTCAGCARHLLVREHFSRRLGAFMGVQIDAEAPGAVPAIVEVFP